MPIDPLFGVELAADELTSNIMLSPTYVVTPNNKYIPLKADVEGRLEIIAGAAGGQETMVRVAFGSVPAAYGAGAQLVTTAFRNILQVRNNLDQAIVITLDGTTDHFQLKSGEVGDYTGVAMLSGATVRVHYDGVVPTSGEVVISAWSNF